MATERQLAANRRNAQRSTGPRSSQGKKQASQNARRHGFSRKTASCDFEAVEQLARELVGQHAGFVRLELARQAAEAHLTIRLVSQTKSRLINRILTFGELRAQEPDVPRMPAKTFWHFLELCHLTESFPRPPDATRTMPADASDRTAEAIRRALPDLVRLERYARRAASRRDAAMRRLSATSPAGGRDEEKNAKRSQFSLANQRRTERGRLEGHADYRRNSGGLAAKRAAPL